MDCITTFCSQILTNCPIYSFNLYFQFITRIKLGNRVTNDLIPGKLIVSRIREFKVMQNFASG